MSVFDGTSTAGSGDGSVWGLLAACVPWGQEGPALHEGRLCSRVRCFVT